MKKKKLLLPFAVMTLSCGFCAGILAGCSGGHKHNYSEWGSDETGHWQICVEDNETTEKEPHVWREDDTCECGAEKPAYGTASGNVKLLKLGENVTDYTGVTIDSGEDDGIEIDYNTQTGAFTITNARVGKIYKFSISKAGYLTTYVNMQAVKGQNVALGDCVLQYDAFTHGSHTGSDWSGNYGNPSKIDKSHANDAENARFTIGEGTGDFYVYSKESYDSVSASVTYKESVTWGVDDAERGNQGLRLVFEDGKAVMIRIEKMSDGKFKAQWIGGNDWEEAPILDKWDFGSGEEYCNPFSAEAETQYRERGVELKLVRNGGVVRAYVNEQFMGEQILPEEYATQQCRVALAAAHVNGGVEIPFSISKTLPETVFDSALTLETGTLPQGVEVSLDKTEGYQLGDLVTLSVKLPEEGDFMIAAINLGGESLLNRLAEGKVSFMLTEKTNVLTVAIKQIEYATLTDVAVTGKKYNVTGNSLADGTTVTLKGQGGLENVEITVTNGMFSKENVAQGNYTAQVAGYKPVSVVIGEDGIPNGITLEYDGFEMLPPNYDAAIHDFSEVNDGVIKVNGDGRQSLNIVTTDSFTDVAVTMKVKDSVAGAIQGIVLKFEDGKYVLLNFKKDQTLIQYRPDCWGMKSVFGDSWIEHAITSADIDAFNSNTGVDLKLVRKGGMLYSYIGDKFIAADALPEGYETQRVKVGFFAFDVKANASWNFKITETLPSVSSAAELTANIPEGAEGIEVKLDKTTCSLGDSVTLTVTLPESGYVVSEITLNGESVLGRLNNGSLTFTATQAQNEVVVTVLENRQADIDVEITGKKYDVTGNSIQDGTTVTLKGLGGLEDVIITVAGGKLTRENVAQGNYTAQVAGYKPVSVVIGEDGIPNGITLEYDGFESLYWGWDWDRVTLDNANEGEFGFNGGQGKTFSVKTKDLYGDVAVTLDFKKSNSTNGTAHLQGIDFEFNDGKVVMFGINLGEGKVQFRPGDWNKQSVWGDTWVEIYLTEAEKTAFQTESGLPITLVRKEGKLYTLIQQDSQGNVRCANVIELPEAYRDAKAQVGFYAADGAANSVFKYNITTTLPSVSSAVELTANIPEEVEGIEVKLDKTTCSLGDSVTLTVTLPESGYVVSEITLNGESVLGRLNNGSLTFTATQAQNEVVVTVLENRQADIDVEITGKKYDVTGNSIQDGTMVTLKGLGGLEDVMITVAGGKLTQENVAQGNYTAQVAGYKSVDVTVGANGIETPIVFEYEDAFDLVQGWGSKNPDQQNDGYLKGGNEMESLLTKALYNNVAFTVYLSGAYGDGKIDGGNQGIVFRFDGGGYVLIRMEGKQKVQFAKPETWWQKDDAAEGADWKDLIFFTEGDEYLRAYAAGTLKLTLVREGATFYAFLNDKYIGRQTVNGKYESVGAHVGIYWSSTQNGVEKTWKFEMSETLPDLSPSITNGTTANGTVALSAATPKYGDEVAVTLTPAEGHILKSLTVGGKDVTGSVTFGENMVGTYTFTATADAEIVAQFESATYGNIDTAISGLKGTEEIALNGMKVTLTNAMEEYEYTIANGKLTLNNVLTGTYTLTADGYVSQTVTVTESDIADAIALVYNIFTSAPDSADLTKLGEGKVTATGNGGVELETKEKYTNVTAEAHFDVPDYNSRRYGIALVFNDGKNFRVDFAVQDGGNNILQQTNRGSMMFNWERVDFPENYFAEGKNSYTEQEIRDEFIAKGLTYKLERDGATVKLYINGVLMKTFTLPDEYKDQEAQLKFIFDSNGTDGTKGFTLDITVPEAVGGEA